ncbi:DUF6975 family protein [Sphingorhabdus sp.]|uniref:DUF6975 family protein n=1 Tax=Sphingorhabdus sp. TaxID=1902408 RepID=UPI0039191AD3
MDNLARPPLHHGQSDIFVRNIMSDGSLNVVAPLLSFLTNKRDKPHFRAQGKSARTALLADISHFMHISHGRHPGIIDYAAQKIVDEAARNWLVQAIDGMLGERAFLNRLTVTAGPIRRLSGQDKVNALVESQAKNFQLLATSDRKGCSSGAVIAFVLDWHQTRPLLDIVAYEMGLAHSPVTLPSVTECVQLVEKLEHNEGYRRAMAFGADQTLAQQRCLWQLVVARHVEMLAA